MPHLLGTPALQGLLALALGLLATGCRSGHQHALLVTSWPSAQKVEASAWSERSARVESATGSSGVTPFEFVFDGEAAFADVRVRFADGEKQEKRVSFRHLPKTYEVHREPILGIPLGTTEREAIEVQGVHFDSTRAAAAPAPR